MIEAGTDPLRRSVDWVYQGVWGVLARWFRVPAGPPTLPVFGGAAPISMRPANGFLSYQRLLFAAGWLGPVAGASVGLVALTLGLPVAGLLIAGPVLLVLAAVVIAGWIGLHLRFDTQWYVLTDRSVRIRRGIWVIQESTITFENVQDITVLQGPLQRYFGISDVIIETAGGGATGPKGERLTPHSGCIEGIVDAAALKNVIAARVRSSRSAGLGDDHAQPLALVIGLPHAAILREILGELRATALRR